MKTRLFGLALYPLTIVIGWVFTRLSEKYEEALDIALHGIDFDDDVPEPLTVLPKC